MTWASMSRALSQRASQKPSRPASKTTAIRLIPCPACSASSRQRLSSFSNALSSTASFFNGWRSTPGTIPATSQLDWPISITAISVASCSRVTRDLLKSFICGMGRSVGSLEQRWCHCPRRSPLWRDFHPQERQLASLHLLDHLISAQQYRWGYGKAERLGGLAVHGHLVFRRQLHREIARLLAT